MYKETSSSCHVSIPPLPDIIDSVTSVAWLRPRTLNCSIPCCLPITQVTNAEHNCPLEEAWGKQWSVWTCRTESDTMSWFCPLLSTLTKVIQDFTHGTSRSYKMQKSSKYLGSIFLKRCFSISIPTVYLLCHVCIVLTGWCVWILLP